MKCEKCGEETNKIVAKIKEDAKNLELSADQIAEIWQTGREICLVHGFIGGVGKVGDMPF